MVLPLLTAYVVWQFINNAPEGSHTPGLFRRIVPFVLIAGVAEMLLIWLERRVASKR